jgi:anti-sigma B factor antagonist
VPFVTDFDQPLSIDVSRSGPDAVVTVAGEIDPHTATPLTGALDDLAAATDLHRVVLDLSGVTFVDSSGLRVLLTARERFAELDIRFSLRSPSEPVHRLLEITDLLTTMDVE